MARRKSTVKSVNETEAATEKVGRAPKKKLTAKVPEDIDLTELITVKNGFRGKLVYISSRTNERFVWEYFGDTQEIELRELRNAKSSAKDFFINNWFMFDEEYEWVVSYLGMDKYYDNAVSLEDFDELFQKPAAELTEILANVSDGQKRSIAYMAVEKVNNGEIDSRKSIHALETALGIKLIEE